MADEKKSLQTEREELELENLRADVEQKRAQRQMRANARQENERAFAAKRQQDLNLFGRCNHKKGGRDYASLQKRGDGENYCVYSWMHPLGHMICICTRCNFLWEPGVTAKTLADGKTPNPTRVSWEDALRLPTDNSPGGSVVFGVRPQTTNPQAA